MTRDGHHRSRSWNALVLTFAMIASLTVSVAFVAPRTVEAIPAPTVPLPACVFVDGGTDGLGCVPGDLLGVASGTFAAGSSFVIDAGAVGLGACANYVSTGCYYEVFAPSFVRCVYLHDDDPNDVRSCGSLSSSGSVGSSAAQRQGSCRGELGSTYSLGGPANGDPSTWWVNRGPVAAACEFLVPDTIDIDNLNGPTFFLVAASVDECIEPGGGFGCDESFATLERRTGYSWLPVEGDLAPRASFDLTDNGAGRYSFRNTSIPFNSGTTTYEWDFGDGETSTATSPTHEFDAAGNYTVRLTMRSSEGPTRTATENIDIDDEIRVTVEAKDVPVDTGDSEEGDDVAYVKVDVTVTNDTTGELTELEFDGGQAVLSSIDIPAEQRGEVAFIEAEQFPASLARGATTTVAVYLQPVKDGLVEVGSWVRGKAASGVSVTDGDGVELELNSEFVTNDDLEIIIQILLLEALEEAVGTLDDVGANLAKQFENPGSTTCAVPQQRDAATDLNLQGIALLSPLLAPALVYSTDWEASAQFMKRQGQKFGTNIWDAGVAIKNTGQSGLTNAGAYWRDLAWAHFTLDHAKRDEMLAETAKQIRGAAEGGVELGESALSAMANIFELEEDAEGRTVVAFTEDYIRTEAKVKSTVTAIYGKACEVTRNRIRQIDTAPTPEAAIDSAADLSGDLLSLIFTEGLMEITGAKAVDLVGDYFKARKSTRAIEAATSLPGDDLPKRIPRMPTDSEIARMTPTERKYWIDKREDLLERARREVPDDVALTLDEMVRIGGLPEDDAKAVQKILADMNKDYGVDVEMELRDINTDSLPFWDKEYIGPDGKKVLPTPKNELAKAKNGNSVDVMIGMDPDGLGRLAVFKPISKADLDSLTRTLDPEMARTVRARWNTQDKNWKSYQDYLKWKGGDDVELGGFGKALSESADGNVQSKNVPVPGRELDPGDASSFRNRELEVALEERGGGTTILVNDASKPLKDGGHAPIISDADWHSVNILDRDGKPVNGAVRSKIEQEIEYRLARETKTFGGHGVTRNGNDFLYKDNPFRLEFLYEQLPPKVARFVRQVRNDGVNVDKLITGQKLVKVTSSGFSRGYGAVPDAGWGSVGKAKSRLDLFKQIEKMEQRAAAGGALTLDFAAGVPEALNATITVNTTTDTVDVSPGNGTCADGAGRCSLRAAIMEANARPGADAITLPAGTYALTIPDPTDDDVLDDDAGAAGDLDVRGDLRLTGNGATIDGRNVTRIFDLGPATHEIIGVTLTRGFTRTDGSAIRTIFSDLVLRNVTVKSNLAEGDGAVYAGDGSLTIVNSKFSDNASFTGGAVAVEYATVVITGGSFVDNVSALDGGAFMGTELRSLVVDGTSFDDNGSGDHGGAMVVRGIAERTTGGMVLRNCSFERNVARAGGGGALYLDDFVLDDGSLAELKIDNCEFRGNLAASGGALWLDDGRAAITKSTFVANSAGDGVGGAIYAFHDISVSGSTFRWNQSEDEGPAIFGDRGVAVSSSTFADNLGFSAATDDPVVTNSGLTAADLAFIEASTLAGLDSSLSPIEPVRLFESRAGEKTVDGGFQAVGRLAEGSTTRIEIAGRGGVDPTASAVAVNVTAVRPSGPGYVTLFPCDEGRPTTSSLNHGQGGIAGNSGVVKLGAKGELCAFAFAETDLVLDVTGWVAAAPDFVPLVPARLAETRAGESTTDGEAERLGRLAAGSTTRIQLTGREGVDSDADAVVLNVTAIRPAGAGYVTLYPCDGDQPLTSSLNYAAGDIKGNSAVVSLSATGELCVFTFAETDLVLDVTASLTADRTFGALVPARVLETRANEVTVDGASQAIGRIGAGKVVTVPITGRAGVPATATAAGVNVTAIRPSGVGYVTLFPCDADQPLTSSLNYGAGGVAGNSAIVKLSADGTLCAFTFADTELVIDVTAAWTNPGGS